MKTDINIHMFPARHMMRAVRLAVLSLLFWVGLMPASAQIYSTAQGGTQYKGTYEEAYGSMNDGYYGSMEAQYEYNPYQSNVYKPGSSTPNTGLRKHHLSVQTPWSDSYAPMRTKKNAPTGSTDGAIGEDNKSENDPEGETGAPDGFITPSDPGHQSNQSPVGEAWVLLFFAAAAALVVFIRQKREKRHIAIYSEAQQPSDKSNMKQHIRKSLFISIILLAGVSNAWAGDNCDFLDPSKGGQDVVYIKYSKDNTSSTQQNIAHNNQSDIDLGEVTNLSITEFRGIIKKHDGNVCAVRMHYGINSTRDGNKSKTIDAGWSNDGYANWTWDNWWAVEQYKNSNVNLNLIEGLSPGTYYFDFYFTIYGNSGGTSGCYDNQKYWSNNGGNYHIKFTIPSKRLTVNTDGNGTATGNQNSITVGTAYSISATPNTGYDFDKWTIENGSSSIEIASTSSASTTVTFKNYSNDATLKATFKGKKYTVTLNNQSATTAGAASVTATYNSAMPSIANNLPQKTGYTFGGYFKNADGTGTQYYNANGTSKTNWNIASNTTLYAKWTLTNYTITYNLNGGTNHPNNPANYTIESAAIELQNPTKTGYTFAGWYDNSTFSGSPVTTIATGSTGNKTFYARWTANTYTVTLDREPSTDGTASVTATYDAAMPAITIPTRTGYTFGGYYTEKNGGGTQYYNENGGSARVWNIAGNTTLYAKWTAIEYTITYENLGGATHSNPSTYTIEDAITFSAPSDRNGYNFTGWIPASIAKGSTGNKTVTATWQEKPGTTVYIKPLDWWKGDDARTAIWAWSNSEAGIWIDVDYDDCTGNLLMAEIPAKYTELQFVRLKPSSADGYDSGNNGYNNENVWTRTENLTVPTDNKNLYDMKTITKLYFTPHNNWKSEGARFAACFMDSNKDNHEWKSMTGAKDGIYSCDIPANKTYVIFCRMNPSTATNNWDNKWNQTGDLTVPTNGQNHYTITELGDTWNDIKTADWSTLFDDSRWTTYTAPTFNVTINPCENGTIKVVYDGKTYTSGAENVIIEDVDIHSELTITFTPAEGYELTTPLVTYADVVADNIYSICGPTVISAEFVQRGSTKVIYLRPNDDWLKDDAIFIAHAWKDGSSDQHDYLMTTKDDDYTGSYSCTIDSKYDHVLFARINPEYKTNQELKAEWMWNKTKDLQITDDVLNANGYRFAIGDKVGGEGENKDHYDGAWEENTPIWGITSDFNNWHAEKAVFMGYPGKLNITLSAGNHEFKLYNFRHNDYYAEPSDTYTRANNGKWWKMALHNDKGNNSRMTADVDNEPYLFQLQLITELGTYKKQISITYPDFSGGAYRLAYRDNTPNSFHPAHLIRCNTQKDLQLDTISFFVRHDKEPEILLQQCSSADVYTDNPVWTTLAIYPATSSFPSGDNPNNAQLPGKRASDATIHIGEGCGVTSTAVYNFILQQTNTGEHSEALDTRATHLYEGEYYIRTNYAEGGWANYLEPSNLMTYSSYADHYEPFSYYFCKWVNPKNKNEAKANITYTIANPYSRCISDTLIGDAIIAKNGVTEGYLPDSANVRFTWDHETNALARAYIKGSGQAKDRFLVLTGKDDNLKDANGAPIPEGTGNRTGLLANEELLSDAGNWIYTVDVTANREAAIKLTAKYNDKTQYFKGSESEYTNLLSSTAHDSYKIRIIYDFKTNQLITAWLPDNSQTYEDEALGTNMMIIRTNHEQATQINFTNNKSISDVGIGYAVMTFTEGHVLGSGTQYARSLYWVSFPFDVWLRDVTGFGEYGQHWIMEYYDGASRAQNGLWADSDTYWKYITNPNYKLEAGKGYVLCLNLGKMQNAFTLTDEVSLYFPSTSPLQEISGEVTAAEVPAHTCTIERDNRNIYDSNWNLIGVPGFKDITGVGVGGSAHEYTDPDVSEECINFYYKYVAETNKYDATANSKTNDFQIMHSYMVQYAGEILWSSKKFSNPPASVAARRTGDMPSEHTLRLELAQGEDKADQTIIKLQEQDATADFDMNIDMTKIKNSGANIYTLTENTAIMVAGNALPMEKTTIPVGIEVANAGTYTLRMPDGTDGISVTLIDNQTGIHTDMLLNEYTITLDAGSHLNRFYIAVDPDRTATSVEEIGEEAKGVKKYLIDGQLFIRTAEGIFDARGRKL